MKKEDIKKTWLSLFTDKNQTLANSIYKKVEAKYNSKARSYHNINHIGHFFKLIEEQKLTQVEKKTLFISALFHDVIYSPFNKNNEEESASFAKKNLKRLRENKKVIQLVEEIIIATKTHQSEKSLVLLFLDMDLSILGSNKLNYINYVNQIRKEYKSIPLFIYNRNRNKFLKNLLSRPSIFKNSDFYNKYEKQARLNIENEINRLI